MDLRKYSNYIRRILESVIYSDIWIAEVLELYSRIFEKNEVFELYSSNISVKEILFLLFANREHVRSKKINISFFNAGTEITKNFKFEWLRISLWKTWQVKQYPFYKLGTSISTIGINIGTLGIITSILGSSIGILDTIIAILGSNIGILSNIIARIPNKILEKLLKRRQRQFSCSILNIF